MEARIGRRRRYGQSDRVFTAPAARMDRRCFVVRWADVGARHVPHKRNHNAAGDQYMEQCAMKSHA